MGALRHLVLVLAAGCTAGVDPAFQPDAPAAPDSAVKVEDTGVEWFSGTLATTATVPFGGPPYCMYSVRLSSIRIDVTVHPTDGLTSMIVADTMNEATVGTCSNLPQPPNRQGFSYLGVPRPAETNGSFMVTTQALPSNSPKTAFTATLAPSGTALASTVRWQRTDQTAPLDWVVTTTSPISLAKRTCETGKTYCLGGAGQGMLYQCVDGSHMTRTKLCTPGCTPADPPRTPHVDEQCN